MSERGWIGVDLDGTLAHYDKWVSATHIGAPIEPMMKRVRQWLSEGFEVRIFTARVWAPDDDPARQVEAANARMSIRNWCNMHLGCVLPITCVKDMHMLKLYDDRAVQVELNTGRIIR